jgi:DNA-binding NarL/FixJ family response regulator
MLAARHPGEGGSGCDPSSRAKRSLYLERGREGQPSFEQDDYIFGALNAGASGFLLKRTKPEELIAAIHTLAAGDSLLSPSVTRRVIERMAEHPVAASSVTEKLDVLTPREREVLELIARGLSNGEIASAFVIEESTVKTHVKRILMKLHLRDRVQAVIFAYESGLTSPGSKSNV